MDTKTGTLTDFLLARIAEDEHAQSRPSTQDGDWHRFDCDIHRLGERAVRFPCDCGVPARVLAECEAKRRIVEQLSTAWQDSDCTECNEAGYLADAVMHTLALPYADHADFRDEWRP